MVVVLTMPEINKYILEESFGFITSRTHSSMNRRLLKNFKDVDHPITTEQYGVMVHLWSSDGKSQQDLCCSTGKDKPSITRIIDNLEKRGFVRRKSCPNDRRKNLIFLTKEGEILRKQSNELAIKTLNEMLGNIDERDLEIAKNVMRKIIINGEHI